MVQLFPKLDIFWVTLKNFTVLRQKSFIYIIIYLFAIHQTTFDPIYFLIAWKKMLWRCLI